MDTPASVLQLPEVSQEILKYLSDVDTNNLEGNRVLQRLVQELQTDNYWRNRALELWSGPIPDEPVDWKSFYTEV
jgi:hypothetical protein